MLNFVITAGCDLGPTSVTLVTFLIAKLVLILTLGVSAPLREKEIAYPMNCSDKNVIVLRSDNPGAVKPLAQRTEEFSDILCEKAGLLHGGKVAAPGHDCPALDIVAALCERARRNRNLLGEDG